MFSGVNIDSTVEQIPVAGCKDLLVKGSGGFVGNGFTFPYVVEGIPGKGTHNGKEPYIECKEAIVGEWFAHILGRLEYLS